MHAEIAYLFRHALLRDAAYSLMVPSTRAQMHALAVGVIEAVFSGAVPGELAPEMALHCRAAGEALLERQIHYTRAALDWAYGGYDLPRALEWAQALSDIAGESERPAALLKLARILAQVGRTQEAGAVIDRVLPDDSPEQADVQAWARMLKVHVLRSGGRAAEAWQIADAVVAGVESLKPATRAAVLGSYVLMLRAAGRMQEAELAEQRAFEAASVSDDKSKEVRLLINAIGPLRSAGRLDEAEAMGNRAVEMARAIRDPGAEGAAIANLANVIVHQGREEAAYALRLRGLELARRIGDQGGESQHVAAISEQQIDRGELPAALETARRAVEIAIEFGDAKVESFAFTAQASALAGSGRAQEALAALDRGLGALARQGDALRLGIMRCTRAMICVALGRDYAPDWQEGAEILKSRGASAELGKLTQRMRLACVQANMTPPGET